MNISDLAQKPFVTGKVIPAPAALTIITLVAIIMGLMDRGEKFFTPQ
jgi:uncharacterized membrane protein